MKTSVFGLLPAMAAGLLILGTLGCGGGDDLDYGDLGTLKGKVIYNGSPVTEGTVTLAKVGSGGSGGAEIQDDGSFEVTSSVGGIPVGKYTVAFHPPMVEVSQGPNSPPSMEYKEMPSIPEKYRNEKTTPLNVEIKEGENAEVFELTE